MELLIVGLSSIVTSLPYDIKHLELTVVVNLCHRNKAEN